MITISSVEIFYTLNINGVPHRSQSENCTVWIFRRWNKWIIHSKWHKVFRVWFIKKKIETLTALNNFFNCFDLKKKYCNFHSSHESRNFVRISPTSFWNQNIQVQRRMDHSLSVLHYSGYFSNFNRTITMFINY